MQKVWIPWYGGTSIQQVIKECCFPRGKIVLVQGCGDFRSHAFLNLKCPLQGESFKRGIWHF